MPVSDAGIFCLFYFENLNNFHQILISSNLFFKLIVLTTIFFKKNK